MEKGPNILAFQKRLSEAGYPVRMDSIWGPETQGATAKLQRDHGLPATGKPDADTAKVLNQILQGRTLGPIAVKGQGAKKGIGVQQIFNVLAVALAGIYLLDNFGGGKRG